MDFLCYHHDIALIALFSFKFLKASYPPTQDMEDGSPVSNCLVSRRPSLTIGHLIYLTMYSIPVCALGEGKPSLHKLI